MYERPQFMTPDGYQRNHRNPNYAAAKKLTDTLAEQKRKLAQLRAQSQTGTGRGISPEAAKLIAAAISGMLKERPGRFR